ncbi:hypothetical protein [Arthrobacter sp. M4]|uniref:hypothetical protein n=1 Tax=Arthrobacter sp. M4 TaxID=218160 RepID=UPI001CDC5224|nr:hypothetical protein [Arthrobacter sp. M4]MCA4133610.1 hypothetical protein [Arthrobacter sp. M4]
MAIRTENKKLRATTLSAAVLASAALALTGCGQTAAKNGNISPSAGVEASATQDSSPTRTPAPSPSAPASATPTASATPSASAAPKPSTSANANLAAQPAPLANTGTGSRAGLVTGSYKPTEATTGVPAGTALTPYNTSGADLVITTDGTVLDSLDIYGDIKVRAKNVVIKNSRLHGGRQIPGGNTGIIDANNANVSNLVVEDNTIIPDAPSYYRDGIVGHDYTAKRNHIKGTNDGMGIFNRPGGPVQANVTAESNYIHALTFWSNDPAHSDGTHNDGIQVQGGTNIRIAGNNVVANAVLGAGSGPSPRGEHAGIGIMLQQNVAKLENVVVDGNWVDDGQTSINIDNGKYSNITVTVQNNLLGRNQLDYGNGSKYPIRIISRAASTVIGLETNRWADTLAFLVEGRDGGIRYNS